MSRSDLRLMPKVPKLQWQGFAETSYNRNLADLRQQGLSLTRDAVRRLDDVYRQFVTGLAAGDVRIDEATRTLSRISQAMTSATQAAQRTQLETVLSAHREVLADIASATGADKGALIARLEGMNLDAVAVSVGRGNVAGLMRSIPNDPKLQRAVNKVIGQGLASGASAGDVSRDLATLFTPESFRGRLPSGSRLHLGRLGRLDPDRYDIDPSEMAAVRSVLYKARRIAVSESNNMLREANRHAISKAGLVEAAFWQVSGRHDGLSSSPDECDILTEQDLYGFGPGMYPPERWPFAPHPFCGCTQGGPVKARPPSQWDQPVDAPKLPSLRGRRSVAQTASRIGKKAGWTEARLARARNTTAGAVQAGARITVPKARTFTAFEGLAGAQAAASGAAGGAGATAARAVAAEAAPEPRFTGKGYKGKAPTATELDELHKDKVRLNAIGRVKPPRGPWKSAAHEAAYLEAQERYHKARKAALPAKKAAKKTTPVAVRKKLNLNASDPPGGFRPEVVARRRRITDDDITRATEAALKASDDGEQLVRNLLRELGMDDIELVTDPDRIAAVAGKEAAAAYAGHQGTAGRLYLNANKLNATARLGVKTDLPTYKALETLIHEINHARSIAGRKWAGGRPPTWVTALEEGLVDTKAMQISQRVSGKSRGVDFYTGFRKMVDTAGADGLEAMWAANTLEERVEAFGKHTRKFAEKWVGKNASPAAVQKLKGISDSELGRLMLDSYNVKYGGVDGSWTWKADLPLARAVS